MKTPQSMSASKKTRTTTSNKTAQEHSSPHTIALPLEAIEKIIINLHPHEPHRLARVSKTFHSLCMKPSDRLAKQNLANHLAKGLARKWDPIRHAATLYWRHLSTGYKVAFISMYGFSVSVVIAMLEVREKEDMKEMAVSQLFCLLLGNDIDLQNHITVALRRCLKDLNLQSDMNHVALRWLAIDGDIEALKGLVALNRVSEGRYKAIASAAFQSNAWNRREMLKWMVSLANNRWELKDHLVYLGCRYGGTEMVMKLLTQKPFTAEFDYQVALVEAVDDNNLELVQQLLIFREVQPDLILLHTVNTRRRISVNIVKRFLNDCRCNFTTADYEHIFWDAAHTLLKRRKSTLAANTPRFLQRATVLDFPGTVKYLLSLEGFSAKIDNYAPLVCAVMSGKSTELVKVILDSTPDWQNITNCYHPEDSHGFIPRSAKCFDFLFAIACERNRCSVAESLLKTGLTNAWAFNGRAFLEAAAHGNDKSGRLIGTQVLDLDLGHLSLIDNAAQCFLNAAKFGRESTMRRLLDFKADYDKKYKGTMPSSWQFDFAMAMLNTINTMSSESLKCIVEYYEPKELEYEDAVNMITRFMAKNKCTGPAMDQKVSNVVGYLRVLLPKAPESLPCIALCQLICQYWDNFDIVKDIVQMGVSWLDLVHALKVVEKERNYKVAEFLLDEYGVLSD
ncbi:hypothetical protein HDU76_012121 [Blyttiomyces sp. JEL0837]|nr:hypothetical protein HDU76_012121 [Blyttiomyces sp. JEL0837]